MTDFEPRNNNNHNHADEDEIYGQIIFYRDGIGYDFRSSVFEQLRGELISRAGFIPLEHVSNIDLTCRRVLPWWTSLVVAFFSYIVLKEFVPPFALIGTILLTGIALGATYVWTETILRIQSTSGDDVQITGPNHTALIKSFRELKQHFHKNGTSSRVPDWRMP